MAAAGAPIHRVFAVAGGDPPVRPQGALQGENIRYVSAGEYHSGAASETNLYGWGSNGYYCTGVGRGNPVQVGPVGAA